jgi:hypothetical protein
MSKKLPFISSDIPKDLRAFLDRVRELLTSQGSERLVSVKDLTTAGIALPAPGGSITSTTTKIGPPSIPLDVTTSGGLANITISWSIPTYYGHSYAEVWASITNDLATAAIVGQTPGGSFYHSTGEAATFYYWIRFVNIAGTFGDFNSSSGTLGQTGANSDGTPRTANGYLYYALSSGSAPSAPSASGYSFSTHTFSSLTSNWSPTFTAPTTAGENTYWAVRYTVNESTFDGTQTVSIGSVFRWQNFDGLVTFSNIQSDFDSGVTVIDGGKITTNTLSADRIESNTTKTVNNTTFGLGTSTTVGGINAGAQFMSTNASYFGAIVGNSAGGSAFGAGTTNSNGSNGAIFAIGNSNSSYNSWTVYSAMSSGYWGFNTVNVGATASNIAGIYLGYAEPTWTSGYAYYITGGVGGPFTAAHDGLQKLTETLPEIGDILVDVALVAAPNVNDSITEVKVSSSANQKGVIGIYAGQLGTGFVPTSLGEYVDIGPAAQKEFVLKPEFENVFDTYRPLVVNAIGEGKINICGEGGDIEIGDLIVTSSIAGKGMKQSDDLVRSITVAKARENVTFSSPTEVKQIACIYLCG